MNIAPAKVEFRYKDGNAFDKVREYTAKLLKNGYRIDRPHLDGGMIYVNDTLGLQVHVYVK